MQPVLAPVASSINWAGNSTVPVASGEGAQEVPSVKAVKPLENGMEVVHVPVGDATFKGFVDGIQRTRVITFIDGVPLAHGYAAAVVRERQDRKMTTWRDARISSSIFLPRNAVSQEQWQTFANTGIQLIDISNDDLPHHPLAWQRQLLDKVSGEREELEKQLVLEWNKAEEGLLWVDGGVSGISGAVTHKLADINTVGVIKSHNTLYYDESRVRDLLLLKAEHRTRVGYITHRLRSPVLSWYLRLSGSASGDPLHGLVRVELLLPESVHSEIKAAGEISAQTEAELSELATTVSGWILAERLPLSLPDARWDRLTYGIHDCESYLRALPAD